MPPNDAEQWRELGIQFRHEGRLDEAAEALRCALALAPADARALAALAHVLRWQGNLDGARAAAERALGLEPQLAEAWFNVGAVQIAQGETARGIESYGKALELKPGFAEAWSNLGDALGEIGDKPGEIEAYRHAAGLNPQLAPIWSNLGSALLEAGKIEEALSACRRAVELQPDFAPAWSNLGNILHEHGEYEEAVRACERAIQLSPGLAEAWSNLGCALMEQGEIGRSLAAHARALEIQPSIARAHYNLGLARERGRQFEAAIDGYRKAVEIDPALAAAWVRLACVLLMLGRFSEGWATYEWRWREKEARPKRFDCTPWAGELAPPRRILLWAEQGIGDEIIYSSMIGDLVDAGWRVTLEIDPRLMPLVRRSFQGVTVVVRTDPPGVDPSAFDCQSSLAGLGSRLRLSFHSFPKRGGYLEANPVQVKAFRTRLRGTQANTLVGISWSSANREFGADKSIGLADWTSVLKVPGTRFVNLQYGDTAHDREEIRQRHSLDIAHLPDVDLYNDLDNLAALCAACDLVITVSNVTAHMAGALGCPVWLLVPRGNGRIWYWFSGRSDSPWYPSMRIFEQDRPREWQPVLDAVARELAAFVKGREP